MESFLSMLLISFMTGVTFVKFARPHPNIAFSKVFTVSRGDSEPEMRFRVANETHHDLASKGDIIDVGFKLILMRIETGKHGEKRLCNYDLKLKTARLISLRLAIELVHTINANSPLFNQTSDDLERSDFVLILLAMSVVVLNRNFGRRETHELRLVRNVWPIINLCNTLTHIIDESSPLHHLSTNELLSGDHFFVVLFTGQDDIISDTMVARKAYHACDILVNHQFEDNITLTPDGLYIDLDAINATYCDSDISSPSKEPDRSPSLVDPAANNEADSTCSSYKLLSE
ncbi:hypothetical protein JG687_00014607 [Phytophthora cactorum]|uniref:Inward rectifier potassium channel C-terminal domain-containing protein n=1 Tax=Phytophthora cactorum TaxID=29920 RepID=A0A8T1U154_9STRA|nr:hypothetical protein JG687_00014607 [Phytophthora cactorum]